LKPDRILAFRRAAPDLRAAQLRLRRWLAAFDGLLRQSKWMAEFNTIEWRKVLAICALTGAVTPFLLLIFPRTQAQSPPPPKPWNSEAIQSTFIEMKVEQVDKKSAALVFYYDFENRTNSNYQLTNGPNLQFLRRLKSDGSLDPEEQMKLKADALVPAGNRARIGLAITEPFAWPRTMDGEAANQFKKLVIQQADNLDGFVLLDETSRYRIELPGESWQVPERVPGT
jgi:hypothetical protein